jgi:hypothetical protein
MDHHVVHTIHFSMPIKPLPMGIIILELVNFNENVINESNITLELKVVHTK